MISEDLAITIFSVLGFMFFVLVSATMLYVLIYTILGQLKVSDLRNKYVMITGCDSGIGRLAAECLDRLGVHVIATCLLDTSVRDLKEKLSSKSLILQLDVTKDESIREAKEAVTKFIPRGTGLWGLINSAGIITAVGPVDWVTKTVYEREFAVNLFGTVNVTINFLPLIKQAKGRVINTASTAGFLPCPTLGAYSCSKIAKDVFATVLDQEMKGRISAHVVESAVFRLPMSKVKILIDRTWGQLSNELRREYGGEYKNELPILAFDQSGIGKSTEIIDAYQHALFSRFPRKKYNVGLSLSQRLWLMAAAFHPWFMRKVVGELPEPALIQDQKIQK